MASIVKTRVGVIGIGVMGLHHLRKIRACPQAELVGFYDPRVERGEYVSRTEAVAYYRSLEELLFEIDAAVIASPTTTHFFNGMKALRAGVHLLVEKPFCANLHEASALVDLAEKLGLLIQVGFVERHYLNAVWNKTKRNDLLYAAFQRQSSTRGREPALSVLWDLMVHDVDLALSFFDGSPEIMEAMGAAIKGNSYDYGRCRLRFPSGVVIDLFCSRVSQKNARSVYGITKDGPFQIDFLDRTMDSLAIQTAYFLNSVQGKTVNLFSGRRALTVLSILETVHGVVVADQLENREEQAFLLETT